MIRLLQELPVSTVTLCQNPVVPLPSLFIPSTKITTLLSSFPFPQPWYYSLGSFFPRHEQNFNSLTHRYRSPPRFQLDKLVGLAMLILASAVFLYYTTWTLLMVKKIQFLFFFLFPTAFQFLFRWNCCPVGIFSKNRLTFPFFSPLLHPLHFLALLPPLHSSVISSLTKFLFSPSSILVTPYTTSSPRASGPFASRSS